MHNQSTLPLISSITWCKLLRVKQAKLSTLPALVSLLPQSEYIAPWLFMRGPIMFGHNLRSSIRIGLCLFGLCVVLFCAEECGKNQSMTSPQFMTKTNPPPSAVYIYVSMYNLFVHNDYPKNYSSIWENVHITTSILLLHSECICRQWVRTDFLLFS